MEFCRSINKIDPKNSFSELKEFICAQLEKSHARSISSEKEKQLTIGLEHEFFLLDKNHKPASHELSQLFLKRLSGKSGWYIREEKDSELGKMLTRISLEDEKGSFSTIKYDHHPHLLEIAFGYRSDLFALKKLIENTFNILSEAAKESNAILSEHSLLDIPANDNSVVSPLSQFQNLRHYRKKLFTLNNKNPDDCAINYAAVIAATQVHIGRTEWWKKENLIEQLYTLEPYTLAITAESSGSLIKNRWQGYAKVFSNYPLVGFPKIKNWSIDSWILALLQSPLAGSPNDDWAGKTLNDLKTNPFNNWNEFFSSVRDLQIIRPRLFGTLEFRADPAQKNPESIVACAALRLGICSEIMSNPEITADFSNAKEKWWDTVHRNKPINSQIAYDLAKQGLIRRGLGEEVLLDLYKLKMAG